MDNHIDLARAERARLILDDPLVSGALADMRSVIRDEWEKSPVRDVEGREHLHRFIKVICQFEGALQRHIETGQLISADIRAEEERKNILSRTMERIRGN